MLGSASIATYLGDVSGARIVAARLIVARGTHLVRVYVAAVAVCAIKECHELIAIVVAERATELYMHRRDAIAVVSVPFTCFPSGNSCGPCGAAAAVSCGNLLYVVSSVAG